MADSPIYRLSRHAVAKINDRKLPEEWIARALQTPLRVEKDSKNPALRHHLLPIVEFDNRVLRVVINPAEQPWVVITAYFDRGERGRR